MILNVSGRTDVVAFYSKWFMNRYKEGFLDVRNPFYPKLVSRIYFKNVDLILFCTKNPLPIINDLEKIKIPILFHVTLTSYQKDIEPGVIPKGKVIEGIKKISKIIGKENIVVRYDPIFFSDKYNLEYHIKEFNFWENSINLICISKEISFAIISRLLQDFLQLLKCRQFGGLPLTGLRILPCGSFQAGNLRLIFRILSLRELL